MSKESRLMKNTAIIAIGNICTKCISFFMLPLYTTILSTEEFGAVDLITTFSTLLIILMTLQFEQGAFRFLIDVRGNIEEQKKYISTSFFAVLCVNFIFAVCVGVGLSAIGYQYATYLVVMVVSGALYGLILQIPRGIGDNSTYAIGSCIGGSLHVILNVLFIAVLSWGVEGMLLATIISYVVAAIFVFVRIRLVKYIHISLVDKQSFVVLTKYSLPLIPYTMCWWVVNASDRILINIFLGAAANGIYAAANKFPSLFSMISNIFRLAWTESASENIEDKQRDTYYNSIVNKAIRFYSSCNIGVIAILPFLFDFLIKKDFVLAYYYIPLLMTAALFHAVADLYVSIYFAFKETKKIVYTTVFAAVVNIAINLVFIKWIGLYAAAISSVLAYLVIIIIQVIDLKKHVNIRVSMKYLALEFVIYMIVFGAYYMANDMIRLFVLILLIPHCLWQNKETIIGLVSVIKKRLKNNAE